MEIPRPTLGDIDLPPRRRLRDGSRSTRSSSTLSSVPARIVRPRTAGRVGRARSGSTMSTLSTLSTSTSSISGAAISVASSRSGSIVPAPVPAPAPARARTDTSNHNNDQPPRIDHGSTLIDMLHHIDPVGDDDDEVEVEESLAERNRRFTAAEKGKGRAGAGARSGRRETIVVDDEEDSIQITGVKRKVEEIESEEEEEEDETRLGAYSCPICFSEPTNAVMTTCGHILCSKCLFSCLLAAIARHPNPHPAHQPRPKPPKKSRYRSKKKKPQPVEWTADQLAETWKQYRDQEYETIAREAGMDEISIQAGRDDSEVGVEMVLKGLWKVDGEIVVEGECPVCRKGIPGGYGPPGKRIGGVMPVIAAIGGG